MEVPAVLPELLGNGVDEGGDVVLRLGLELGHALRRGRGCASDNLVDRGLGDGADLRPRRERRELDVEPP